MNAAGFADVDADEADAEVSGVFGNAGGSAEKSGPAKTVNRAVRRTAPTLERRPPEAEEVDTALL